MASKLPLVVNPLGQIRVGGMVQPAISSNNEINTELYGITRFASDWIDFGATGEVEVYQNVKYIILTPIRSVVLDREFGMDFSMVDRPIPIAKLMLSQECAMKIALYEPRCYFENIDYYEDQLAGYLNPDVKIVIVSIEELASLYPSTTLLDDGSLVTAYGTPFVSPTQEIEFRGTLSGIDGAEGQPGTPGLDGAPGSKWYDGPTDPNPAELTKAIPGDYYLNHTTGDVFELTV